MLQTAALDQALVFAPPTFIFVAVCTATLLGLFLIIVFVQQRNVPALAWWGSAYLIGASSIMLANAPAPRIEIPPEIASALAFIACGMVWNGVRQFQGRRPLTVLTSFGGGIFWVIVCQVPAVAADDSLRFALGVLVVAIYSFLIAFELGRERRKSKASRITRILIPCLHAAIFLMPLGMHVVLPEHLGASWQSVFALETFIYTVGTAFIVLLTVKDHYVGVYRTAATTDHLTGLLNRRAFIENGLTLAGRMASKGEPVTLMMFDLDHFKSINDRFGHAVGDDALRVFAEVMRTSTRANDISGRLGGEEFAAILPGGLDVATIVAERIRANFQAAGVTIGEHAVGATVSIGATVTRGPVVNLDGLLARADAALYRAKHEGRNRMCTAPDGGPLAHPSPAAKVNAKVAAPRTA